MNECAGGGCCTTTSALLAEVYNYELQKDYDGTPRSVAPLAPLPDFGFNADDPDPIDVLRRHAALCNAVVRYCYSVFEAAATAMSAAGYVVDVAVPAGAVVNPVVGVVVALFGVAIDLLVKAFSDEEAIQETVCCMYASLVGAETSYEAFANSPGACGFEFPQNRAQLAGFLGNQNQHFMNYALFLRVLQSEFEHVQASMEPEVTCLCPGPCVALFDFEHFGRLGWYLTPGVPQGHWVDDSGWVSDANDDGHYLMYVNHLCEPVEGIASVHVSVTCSVAEGNMIWLAFYDEAGATVYQSAQASVIGKHVYTFQTNGIAAARVEVSQRTTPTAHTTGITVHAVELVAF
jgi:hypothetical protein